MVKYVWHMSHINFVGCGGIQWMAQLFTCREKLSARVHETSFEQIGHSFTFTLWWCVLLCLARADTDEKLALHVVQLISSIMALRGHSNVT